MAHQDGQDKSSHGQLLKEQQDQSFGLKELQLLIAAGLNPEKPVSPPTVQNIEVPVEDGEEHEDTVQDNTEDIHIIDRATPTSKDNKTVWLYKKHSQRR